MNKLYILLHNFPNDLSLCPLNHCKINMKTTIFKLKIFGLKTRIICHLQYDVLRNLNLIKAMSTCSKEDLTSEWIELVTDVQSKVEWSCEKEQKVVKLLGLYFVSL